MLRAKAHQNQPNRPKKWQRWVVHIQLACPANVCELGHAVRNEGPGCRHEGSEGGGLAGPALPCDPLRSAHNIPYGAFRCDSVEPGCHRNQTERPAGVLGGSNARRSRPIRSRSGLSPELCRYVTAVRIMRTLRRCGVRMVRLSQVRMSAVRRPESFIRTTGQD